MSLSLATSIFGQNGESNNELTSVFDSSTKLPSKRNLVPAKPSKRAAAKTPEIHTTEITRKRKPSSSDNFVKGVDIGEVDEKKGNSRKKPKSSEIIDESCADDARNDRPTIRKGKHEKNENSPSLGIEGDDEKIDPGAADRTIFVGNLPLSMTRKKLTRMFSRAGKVESTRIRSVAVQGVKLPPQSAGNQKLMRKICVNKGLIADESVRKTVQGYVVFEDASSVTAALLLNNTLIPESDGLLMRVDTATPTIDAARSVFVGNLPYAAEESLLHEHFVSKLNNGEDSVEGVRIVRDPEAMQCKGFGYVLLKNKALVAEALRLHQSTFMKREIRVQVCGKRYKGSKGQEASDKDIKNFEGRRATPGVAQRILGKLKKTSKLGSKATLLPHKHKKRRTHSERNAAGKPGKPEGVSKRTAADNKTEKRVKKLKKRIAKGMGKTKHSA